MIIDNFGTIKPNPWRFYRPRFVTGVSIDEAAVLANWQPGPLMVLPDLEMPEEYRDLVERITKPVQHRVRVDGMRRAYPPREWPTPATPVEGSDT